MWLPTPSSKSVDEFRALVRESKGIELTEAEARDAATRLLQIHYLHTHAFRDLRTQVHRK